MRFALFLIAAAAWGQTAIQQNYDSRAYNYVAQSPGGSLSAGACSFVMNPVPKGVVTGGSVYLSGGTGTAEAIAVTVSGSTASGTCSYSHSGAWTVASASGGLQEAICMMPSDGGEVVVGGSITLRRNVTDCGKTSVMVRKLVGATITGSFSIAGATVYGSPYTEIYTPKLPGIGVFPVTSHYLRGTNPDYVGGSYWNFAVNTGDVPETVMTADSLGGFQYASIVGMYNSTHDAGQGNVGVAGISYGTGASSAGIGIVGKYVAGGSASTGAYGWGANFVVEAGGKNVSSLAGVETDLLVDAYVPTVVGHSVVGYASVAPAMYEANIVDAGAVESGYIPWYVAFHSRPGGVCQNCPGLQLDNTPNDGTAANSHTIKFTSIDAGLAAKTAEIQWMSAKVMQLTGGPFRLVPVAYATLPTCNSVTQGSYASVTDSNTATWGAAVANGGANLVGVFCNGSAWTVSSK